jgi:uncharacterized membrane protein YraQ (UPF0718 family)
MKRKNMDPSFWILAALTATALAIAAARGRELPLQAVFATGRMLRGVLPELALGFLLAGLFEVLMPARTLSTWLGSERGTRGIFVGWGVGLLLPGGPYLVFPIVASLFAKGAGAGALIALISAKTLVSPIRMLTYEAPLLGWPLTLARLLPALFLPPLLGIVGQWLFVLLQRK